MNCSRDQKERRRDEILIGEPIELGAEGWILNERDDDRRRRSNGGEREARAF